MKKIILILIFTTCVIALKAQNRDSVTNNKSDTTWVKVDVEPQFPGGVGKLYHFLEKNVKYPDEDRQNNVTGIVRVAFVVEKDGSLSNIRVIKSLSATADAEAIRVMNSSPKWRPGSAAGVPCRVNYSLPVKFRLESQ